MKKPLLIIFALFNLFGTSIKCNNISFIPKVINYSASEYEAGNQNWSISQSDDNNIIIGNNQGLLKFDGVNWQINTLSNHSPVRSVLNSDDRIYVGAFEEFGYFKKDGFNNFKYHSLSRNMPYPVEPNEEFWSIVSYRNIIIFQSFSRYYIYDGERVMKGSTPRAPLFVFKVNDSLFCQFIEGGFGQFDGTTFNEIFSREELGNGNVVSALSYNDGVLLVTSNSGLYFFNNKSGVLVPYLSEISDKLKNGICNRAIYTKDSLLIIGTIDDGVFAFSNDKPLWHINKSRGLINNTILSLYEDFSGNIWAGTDNGIALICKNSPISIYKPINLSLGMLYDIYHQSDNYYFCTNQGLYRASAGKEPKLIQGTQDQCWYISKIGQQLFLGHNKGLMEITNDNSRLMKGPHSGGLAIRKCKLHGEEILLQLSYSSLSVFTKKSSNRWEFSHVVRGVNNRIKNFEVSHDGTIWAAHQYQGVYRIRLDETLNNIKEIRYYKSFTNSAKPVSVNVMLLRGRVIFTAGNRFYTYDDVQDDVVVYEDLNIQLPEFTDTYRIVNISDDFFWFIRKDAYSMVEYKNGVFNLKSEVPLSFFKNPPIEGQANVFVDNCDVSYINLDGGIARYDFRYKNIYPDSLKLSIGYVYSVNKAKNINRSLVVSSDSVSIELKPEENSIAFKLSLPSFGLKRYRVLSKLSGYDSQWSEVVNDNQILYSNLKSGDYTLYLRLIDDSGKELSGLNYSFKVLNYWFLKPVMLMVYLVFFILLLYTIMIIYTKSKIQKQRKLLKAQDQSNKLILKEKERMITKLENEKLEEELNFKNRELTNTVLALKSSDDFLFALKNDFQKQIKTDPAFKQFLSPKVREINDKLSKNEDWSVYMKNFDGLNEQFFKKLKKKYPDLTPGDLRMCAFLRMNMPTKDIARFQNVSVRGVEASRYRLRKKLGIEEHVNLVDFILSHSILE